MSQDRDRRKPTFSGAEVLSKPVARKAVGALESVGEDLEVPSGQDLESLLLAGSFKGSDSQVSRRQAVVDRREGKQLSRADPSGEVGRYVLTEVGTPLVNDSSAIESRAARDPAFLDALESATSALNGPGPDGSASAAELIERTAHLDSLNLQARRLVYEYSSYGKRRSGPFIPR